jgi:hypothetical protein
VDVPQPQQDAPVQQAAVDSVPVACKSSSNNNTATLNGAEDPQKQQQQSKQQQLAHAKAAAAPVPRLQLQRLRNMDLGLVDSAASPSSKSSSKLASGAAASSLLGALSAPQQQQQSLKPALPAGSTAGTTQAGVAPLPSWRSALTTRWQPGGRFKQQRPHASESHRLQGSQTSRL